MYMQEHVTPGTSASRKSCGKSVVNNNVYHLLIRRLE